MKNVQTPQVKISASVHQNTKFRKSALPLIFRYVILLCGCCGSVFTFLTCFDFNISGALLFAAIAVSGALFSVIFSLDKKYSRCGIALSAAALLTAVFFFRSEISAGFANVLNIYLARVLQRYAETPFLIISEPELSNRHIFIFFLFAALLMCFCLAYFSVKKYSITGICIITGLWLIAVLYYGLEPHPAAFSAVMVCWAATLSLEIAMSGRISEERFRKYASYCGMTTAVAAALCFAAIIAATKIFDYKRPEKLDELYEKSVEYIHGEGMKNTIDSIVTAVKKSTGATGAINHGKLGEIAEITFEGRTVLQVTMPKPEETVYLRGYTGSVYTGSTWDELPDSKLAELEKITSDFETSGLSSLLFDSYSLKNTPVLMPSYSFTVKNLGAHIDYLYLPYNLVPESVSRYEIINHSAFYSEDKTYFGQIYDPGDYYGYQNIFRTRWSVSSEMKNDEAAYRQFVYENYLDIPESFDPTMIFTESYYDYITAEEVKTGKSTLDEMTVFSRKLYYIKDWLRNNCEYSLKAGKLPSGEDFVNFFLENRKGSCTHFASAAAIMCRYAGIPARYVEGYVLKSTDFPSDYAVGTTATVDVTDARGHAWVEVYIDGFGWYPVEFTSGYGNIRISRPTSTSAEPEIPSETVSNENEPETTSVQQDNTQSPSEDSGTVNTSDEPNAETTVPVQESENETRQSSESANTDNSSAEITANKQADKWYVFTWILTAVLVLASIPAVIVLRRSFILSRRRRNSSDINSGVLEDYRRFEQLLAVMEMPKQDGMEYSEYAEELSKRSPLFAEKTAELIIHTALKASFGGNSLTPDEAQEMHLALNSLAKRYYNTLSFVGKLRLKYIYCIV